VGQVGPAETDNGRTYWEDGSIRYTPDPDFHGTDSFTYTVTDGLAEDTGTVTVTVNSVNDAPVAFNDAFTGNSSVAALPPAPPNTAVIRIDVLANDIDYDGSGLTVGALQAPGSVAISADKRAVEWSVPLNSTAQVEFTYQAKDDEGALSSMVTVEAWAYPITAIPDPPPPPTVVTAADAFAVGGDDVTTGNVRANDTGGKFAVLRTHPAGTRVDSFGFDGSVELTPTLARADASFEYALFSADGKESPTGTVYLSNVNLTIYHGQYTDKSKPVSELNERVLQGGAAGGNPLIPAFKATGAFTVANLNDSDVNGHQDNEDNDVPANPNFPGSGEVDLMKLVLNKPTPIAGKNTVTLTVSSSSTPGVVPAVKLWKVPTKGNQPVPVDQKTGQVLGQNGQPGFPVNAIPDALWVEFTGISIAVADVSIKMEYAGASDTVNATGIWTKRVQDSPYWPDGYFMNTGTALPEDADARRMRNLFTEGGSALGQVDNKAIPVTKSRGGVNVTLNRTANNELSKFTTMPAGLTPFVTLGIVSFDVTRSNEGEFSIVSSQYPQGTPPTYYPPLPRWLDVANDEHPFASEDNDNDLVWGNGSTATDNLYSFDSPGFRPWYSTPAGMTPAGVKVWYPNAANEWVMYDFVSRDNFFDFVRIKTGTQAWASGAGVQGSRASVYYYWHSMMHLRPAAGGPPYTTTRFNDPATPPGKTENEIAPGLINVDLIGG
jgi:hypothetical protein